MLPSLIHDWLFYNHQTDRETTDDIFYELLRKNKVSYLKATAMWAAVRAGGGLFWDNDKEDTEMLKKLCKKVRNRANYEGYQFPSEIKQLCYPN
ncbi:MAG: DUF1353 domain-containing protein [Paraglaciecola sp.]|uniref:DUF1353 domain-containing protein n=1 Tax=Paraglaciecola sp. TaxID=1920173 RepID=UPI003298340F